MKPRSRPKAAMLKGPLCIVRHLLTADLNAFIALVNDLPSRGDYFSAQFKSPEAMRKEFMQNVFVIEDQRHHVIGVITHFKSRTPVSREIGYRLFDPALAGRGYTSEALRLLVDYLFNVHQYHRLELLTAPENSASVRVAEKCGFSVEGLLRQAFFIRGRYCDVSLYALLRPDWERRRR